MKLDDDGSEAFVHHSAYAGPMAEDDRLKAEIKPGPKGPRAEDVELLSRGTPKPVPAPTPSPPTAAIQSQEIEVEWSFGAPTKKGRSNVLLLTLTLHSGKSPRSGIEVKLKAEGKEVKDPVPNPSTDGQGRVIFLVPLLAATKLCALAAEIKFDGKTKVYAQVWEKRRKKSAPATTATAAPATDAEKKLPEIEVVNPPRDPDPTTGQFLVNVVTRKNGKKADRDFVALSDQTVEISQSDPPGLAVVTTFKSDTTGHYPLYVNFDGIMVKIVFQLDDGKEAEVWLRK